MKKYVIPFGICEVDKKGLLKKITEKPSSNYLVNTGMYVVNKEVIKLSIFNHNYNQEYDKDFFKLINPKLLN